MTRSLLELLEKLKNSSNEDKVEATKEVSDFILSEIDYSEQILKSHLLFLLRNESFGKFKKLSESEYFISRLSVYNDGSKGVKIAFGISFLQSLEEFESNLEDDIVSLISFVITESNLETIINDISVNSIQMRNNSIVDLKKYHTEA